MRALHLLLQILATSMLIGADGSGTTKPGESVRDRDRHEEFLKIAKAGGIDLLFVGDSITDGWRRSGKPTWDKYFAPLKAANFGVNGAVIQHVIWRLRNGELEGIHPKVVVLMIGTNNPDAAENVALGVKTIITDIQQLSPETRILLLGILPRDEGPDARRAKNEKANQLMSAYATPSDPRRVVYLDIGSKFLNANQIVNKDLLPDKLHPNDKGYQIWAEAIIDVVKQLMQDDPGQLAPIFAKPATLVTVAKLEASIAAGGIAAGSKALEKLATDKDVATAEAAAASLAVVIAWKASVDAEITRLRGDGEVYIACEMAATMARNYPDDATKAYLDQVAELKKDPAYSVGKEFQHLVAFPYENRKDPEFSKLVEAFLKRHPNGSYALKAQVMISK